LSHGSENGNIDFHMHDGLLFHLGKICIPNDKRNNLIREDHTSHILGHFGVRKMLANLLRYCYWPKMQENVSKYIRGCMLCNVSKPNNRKLGLYLHCQLLHDHGKVFPWILLEVFLFPKENMIICMWLWID